MDKNKFKVILTLIIPQVIQLMIDNYNFDEITATDMFYKSKLYELLEDEETKIWHYSPLTLFYMFDSEYKTGEIEFPEEV